MRLSIVVVTLLLFADVAALAQNASAPAWSLSSEARLRERFDPREQLARREAERPNVKRLRDGMWPINGKTHAHLFFPWEVMDFFLKEALAPSPMAREMFRKDIAAAGWDYDSFWSFIDAVSADYDSARRQLRNVEQATAGPGGGASEQARLRRAVCRGRAEALALARNQFGAEAFDKFLYTSVASRYVSWSTADRTPAILVSVEGGCR